ncbi:MAG: glutamate--tRNA ligase [Phycisphaerae bacterium]|nr:glutamate--tRNA ligase [Tepidisphaeraceae bacterium]
MPTAPVITRFAPSPTGYLHVGGARTALFNWLLARHEGAPAQFLLRIEDTDLARSTQQACDQLLEDLRWLGLQWDNTDSLVFQSKRQHIYNAIIDDLVARGLAYEAWESAEELAALRQAAEKAKRSFVYRRPTYSPEEINTYKAQGRRPVVRFAMPVKEYRFFDVLAAKDIVQPAEECQDFVIRKADGMPTYHFAVVVDDAHMNVTHVLRGQEHTKNTFLHIALQEALGYARPTYAHLSTIQNPDGSKMGKRDRDKKIREAVHNWVKNTKKTLDDLAAGSGIDAARLTKWVGDSKTQLDPTEHDAIMPVVGLKSSDLPEILIHDFRKNGYIPEALLNFLALLGWSPGENREIMSVEEMIKLFSVERINNANAKFDRAKLLAFNTQTAETLPPVRLVGVMRQYLAVNPDSPLNAATEEQLAELIAMKKGFRTLREVDEASRFFFVADDAIAYDPKAVEKVLRKDNGAGLTALRDLAPLLTGAAEWKHDALEATVKAYAEAKGLGLGAVAQPLRVALSGGTVSPPIFNSLEFLGRERTLVRIGRCLATITA